jgi:sulfur carrier protein ThiS
MKIRTELVGFLAGLGLPNGFMGGELEVPEGARLKHVLALLDVSARTPLLVTVNGRRAEHSLVLHEGDIVRFVPHIGGG